MGAKVAVDLQAFYEDLIQNQWDNIEPPTVNLNALRQFILRTIPFYSSALQMVDIHIINDKKDLPSFAFTNGYSVTLSPRLYTIFGMVAEKSGKKWFKTPELGLTFSILHELGHLCFDSFGRISHRDHKMWNIATDYQINQFVARIMKESNVFKTDESYTSFMEVLNSNFVFDPAKYSKLSAESTYDDLYKVGAKSEDYDGWSMNGDMVGDGSGADEDGKPLSAEEQMARDIIKSELKDYSSKNADKLPGQGSSYGRDFAAMLEPPKVNLRQVLKHITDRENSEDFGWDRRGSRMDHMVSGNIRLPTVIPNKPDYIRKVMMVIDASGSMDSSQLNDYLNIVREVTTKHTRNPIHLIIHTDSIQFSGDIKSYKDVPTNITGGTAFRPVLEEIKRLEKQEHVVPSIVCWGSDLYGELAEDEYNLRNFPFGRKLTWLITGSDLVPKIGRYYHLDEIGK